MPVARHLMKSFSAVKVLSYDIFLAQLLEDTGDQWLFSTSSRADGR